MNLSGILVPIITPFEHQRLAMHRYRELFTFWEQFDLSGYVLMGSTGELPHLTEAERFQLVFYVTDHSLTTRPVIVGCAEHSLMAAVNFLTYCKDAGVAAGLVLPPHYYKGQMRPDVLVEYYHRLAEESGLPIIVYHFPAVSGMTMSVETLLAIARHPGIIGIKDSSGNVALQQELAIRAPKHFQVLTGSANTLLASLLGGAAGGIVAAANYAPDVCTAIYRAVQRGDLDTARRLQQSLLEINRLTTEVYGIGGLKHAMELRGAFLSDVRFPLIPLSQQAKNEIQKAIKTLLAKKFENN